jgi:hypothetical protein
MRTGFALIMGVTLGVLILPPCLHAQFTYTITNSTIAITGYTGPGGDVAIPGAIDGLPVTDIAETAFAGRELSSVTIPDSVFDISTQAFFACTNLTSVIIGNGVTNIGPKAFMSCPALTNVAMGDDVRVIDDWAFARCYALSTINLPDGLRRIGEGVFYLCAGLTNVTVPNGVSKIDEWTFAGCAYLLQASIGTGITRIADRAFSDCFSLASVNIPDRVKSIGSKAFYSCYSLTNVTIGNAVTTIEDSAFSQCYTLARITFGRSLIRLEDFVFFLCANLREVNFMGDQPAFLGDGVFAGAENATVYYLPGTSGWSASFNGLPTAFWSLPHPVILNFGPQTNGFGFVVSWATNIPVVVEASLSLNASTWFPVSTNVLINGSTQFGDPEWKERPARFFRVRAE